MQEGLVKMNAAQKGWKTELVPNSSTRSVAAYKKLVEIGENSKPRDGLFVRVKVLHEEIAGHAKRAINAEDAGWLSATYGQENSLDFEEALCTAYESAYRGTYKEEGANYYVMAGLALGLDNHQPRDFREVYEIMWRANTLNKLQANPQTETNELIDQTKSAAFNSVLRIFRGTTTEDKGLIYTKDLSYFRGQVKAWQYLEEHVHTQQGMDLLEAGKLDLTNPEQLAIAHKIRATLQSKRQ